MCYSSNPDPQLVLSSCSFPSITGSASGNIQLGTTPFPTLHINPTTRVQLKSLASGTKYTLALVDRYGSTVYSVVKESGTSTAPLATRFYLTKYGSIISQAGSATSIITQAIDPVIPAVYSVRLGETWDPNSQTYKAWMRVYKPDDITWAVQLPPA